MTDDKTRPDALVKSATDADADPDRHEMEAAVLATVAQHGLDAEGLLLACAGLSWSRRDFGDIAAAMWDSIAAGIPADAVIIRDKLTAAGATVNPEVLTGILDGSKVKAVAVAEAYVKKLEGQDRFRRAGDAGRDYLAAVEKARAEGGDADAAVGELLKTVFDLAHKKKLVREAWATWTP
jgi:hypothetical protein